MPTLKAIHICNSHQPTLNPKIAKEYVFADARQTETKKQIERKNDKKINTERLTSCIKHLADSGLSSGTARIKSGCNLIGNRFELPNVSYT